MSSPPTNDQVTLSTADPNRLGGTPSNPILDSSVINSPNVERYIVYNPAHGFYAVTAQVAHMWRGYGYAIMDSYGNRVTDFDGELNAVINRYAESDRYEAFFNQEDEIWELLDMAAAMAELGSDETIVYGKLVTYWGRCVDLWLITHDRLPYQAL